MSYKLTEQETQSEAPKKLPYNLREKREKDAAYRTMIRADLADELYQKIVDIVIVKKKYKDPNFSSKDLAKLLQTNTRYLSAVVNSRFGMNYSCLLNEYRVKDALRLLADKKNADKNVEEINEKFDKLLKSNAEEVFNILSHNLKYDKKIIYDYEKKYKGFIGMLRRNIKRSI